MNCIRMWVSAGLNAVGNVAGHGLRRASIGITSLAVIVLSANLATGVTLVPAVIYSETFETDATGAANVAAAYPNYVLNAPSGTDINVASGVLQLDKPINTTMSFLTSQSFINEPLTIRADLTASGTGGGNDAVGIVMGNLAAVMFPNNGTLRWLSGSLTGLPSDVNMGITIAKNVMHQMEIELVPNMAGGADITVTVTNGANSSQVYTSSTFVANGYIPGKIGFMNIYSTVNVGLFDNLEVIGLVEFIPPAPEPSSALLLGMGALGLLRARRRQRPSAVA